MGGQYFEAVEKLPAETKKNASNVWGFKRYAVSVTDVPDGEKFKGRH